MTLTIGVKSGEPESCHRRQMFLLVPSPNCILNIKYGFFLLHNITFLLLVWKGQ